MIIYRADCGSFWTATEMGDFIPDPVNALYRGRGYHREVIGVIESIRLFTSVRVGSDFGYSERSPRSEGQCANIQKKKKSGSQCDKT